MSQIIIDNSLNDKFYEGNVEEMNDGSSNRLKENEQPFKQLLSLQLLI